MFRPFLPFLPVLAFCLPALAGMPAGLTLGEKEKDAHQKVVASKDFTPLNERAKRRLETNFRLSATIAGQKWAALFVFDRRSKMLSQLIFVSDRAMQPNQYDKLLKSFYVFTTEHLREHFKLQDPLNMPEFGHAGGLKEKEMFPLHSFPGEGIMLTTGLWKDENGGIRPCFSVQPSSNSAMGQTYTSNTAGTAADWEDIPAFASTEEGQAFLKERGIEASLPSPKKEEEIAQVDEEPEPEEEVTVDDSAETVAAALASKDLPQVEQDMLNALILFNKGNNKEALAKLIAAAQSGNARALYELGRGYAEGRRGLSPNSELSQNAFRRSALSGFALALVRYGAEFPVALAELGFKAEDGRKMVQVAEGAGASSPSGRFNHAIMLRYGYGVRKDVDKALEMMQQLATEGDPEAATLAEEWAQ